MNPNNLRPDVRLFPSLGLRESKHTKRILTLSLKRKQLWGLFFFPENVFLDRAIGPSCFQPRYVLSSTFSFLPALQGAFYLTLNWCILKFSRTLHPRKERKRAQFFFTLVPLPPPLELLSTAGPANCKLLRPTKKQTKSNPPRMFEFSFFHQKAKEEPSRFATLLKRARQPSLLRIVKVTQCKQNTAWQKLQKKREEEKEEEKAVPMPKSVPDVEEKGKFGEQQAARAKWFGGMKPAEPAGLPPEKKQRAKSLNGTKVRLSGVGGWHRDYERQGCFCGQTGHSIFVEEALATKKGQTGACPCSANSAISRGPKQVHTESRCW